MIFDFHSDILVKLANDPSDELWDNHYKTMFQKGASKGGIWAFWMNGDFPKNQGVYGQFDIMKDYITNRLPSSIRIVKNKNDYESAFIQNQYPVILGIEGLWGADKYSIKELHYMGFRHAMLTWADTNAFAGGNNDTSFTKLSYKGKEALKEMAKYKMIIDTSHLNDSSFWDLCETIDGPIVASHSNARAICNHPRNLSDAQIKEISRRKGLIGINIINSFIDNDKSKANLKLLMNHVDHILNLTGNSDILCLGLDWLGFFDDFKYACVKEFKDMSEGFLIIESLSALGLSSGEIEKIAYKNALAMVTKSLDSIQTI